MANVTAKDASAATVTFGTKLVGGINYPYKILINPDQSEVTPANAGNQATQIAAEQALVTAMGEVQATPTSNTLLDRLKQLLTGITSLGTKLDTVNTNLTTASGASEVHVGQFGGTAVVAGGSFTRPADTTAYASGDLVANSTTAASVAANVISGATRINAGTGRITGARLSKSGTSLTNASFRVHFFKGTASTPFVTVANGDNGAFSPNTIAAIHIGYVDIIMDVPGSDGAKGAAAPARNLLTFDAAAGRTAIYWLLEARGAYTPTSGETFTVAAEIDQD